MVPRMMMPGTPTLICQSTKRFQAAKIDLLAVLGEGGDGDGVAAAELLGHRDLLLARSPDEARAGHGGRDIGLRR